jgi:hypothetical protein
MNMPSLRRSLSILALALIVPACSRSSSSGGGIIIVPTSGTLGFSQGVYTAAEDDGSVSITVERAGGSAGAASVLFQSTNGSAGSPADYEQTSVLLQWADGDNSSRTVTISLQSDAAVEGDETVNLTLTGAVGATLGLASATLVITDNDAPAAGVFQFADSVLRVVEGDLVATVTVTRTGGSTGAVTVDYATADGTATEPGDYADTNGQLSFADGDDTPQTIDIPIVDDAVSELIKQFTISLSGPSGGSAIGTIGTETVVIVDDDRVEGFVEFTQAHYSIYESVGAVAVISVTRFGGSSGAASVDYATADGTALVAAPDYDASSGTLNWADGEDGVKTFTVVIQDDALIEGNETVLLSLTNATGAALGFQTAAVLNIVDSDPTNGVLQFTSATYTVLENGISVDITVSRSLGFAGAVSVDYATSDGSAVEPDDYVAASGTLNWADGDGSSKTFTVTIVDDALVEGDETVNLTLSNPMGGAVLGALAAAVLTLQDDESPIPGEISIVIPPGGYSVLESAGPITITVRRSGGADGAVSVKFATSNGSANGADYQPTSGTLNWADGDSADKTFNVTIKNNDNQTEVDETFNVTLSAPTGGATLAAPTSAVVTIIDD